MKILRISCSPHGQDGESHRLSDVIVECLAESVSAVSVTERLIGIDPVPHIAADYISADYSRISQMLEEEKLDIPTAMRSEELIGELERADVIVIATPMHNLGLPSSLKAWIDHVVRPGRTFEVSAGGKIGLLRDRPVFVAVAAGGRYSGARAHQPDFLTPHLRAILGSIGLSNPRFFSIEKTAQDGVFVADARIAAARRIREHFRIEQSVA
jgi:FMN-dependent NADH-azoreductase